MAGVVLARGMLVAVRGRRRAMPLLNKELRMPKRYLADCAGLKIWIAMMIMGGATMIGQARAAEFVKQEEMRARDRWAREHLWQGDLKASPAKPAEPIAKPEPGLDVKANKVVLADGRELWLGEMPLRDNRGETGVAGSAQRSTALPFSFMYDGVASDALLSQWPKKVETKKLDANRTQRTLAWTDPKTGLEVRCVAVE